MVEQRRRSSLLLSGNYSQSLSSFHRSEGYLPKKRLAFRVSIVRGSSLQVSKEKLAFCLLKVGAVLFELAECSSSSSFVEGSDVVWLHRCGSTLPDSDYCIAGTIISGSSVLRDTGLLPDSIHAPPYSVRSSVVSALCLSYQMANRVQIPSNNSALIAMIADEDTVVGFLLAGVGNVDIRRKTNYLIVDAKTTVKQIEDAFKEFTTREDIAIVMISQYVANMIRFLVDSYNKPVPAILEIPSKDHPYDPAHDSVLSRVKYLFNTESVASGRR
ncbi:hypothetical protein V8G54_000642 [Vigna mungo]